ncbi:hypothetical protein QWI17_15430 [Gilvimarinus sp. SDUM040013]|uniref:Uncharacterized protein n=1 Tax=Gilvimarinus gilvus TaxID=3058038 RepID=A0ABU4S2N8_9GAMM|nr:hypothetical protein [Gilvimarinus sp. SDUM040013]MDO3387233.1 hypothetical protein [Gilvimarinus sp. SDUM040013]MDX6851398.1 hypothetical protein [Gilvimarinus sp. SDUM040013]
MTTKRIYIGLMIMGLLLGLVFVLAGNEASDVDSLERQGGSEYDNPASSKLPDQHESIVSAVTEGDQEPKQRPQTDPDTRNPFDGNTDKNGYEHYSIAELESLAEAGDVYAMLVLLEAYGGALQLMGTPADIRSTITKIESMARKAVIFGDKQALALVEENNTQAPIFYSDTSTDKQKSEAMIDVLALYEFAGMRGDLSRRFYGYTSFFDHFWPEKTSITAEEKQAIRNRAEEIYRAYEDERIELGLGPFDNSVKDKDKKFNFSLDDV